MRFPYGVFSRAGSLIFATILLAGAGFAQVPGANDSASKPLKERDNPLMIGKRDINKGSLNFYSLDREIKLGQELAAEVDRQSKFVTDPVVTEYVNRVGQNVILRSDAKLPFTIKVIDSPDVNAFALPGGHLYVNSGLVLAADTEAELAGVIAHEISHVTARHGVEQASKGRLLQYLSIPLIFVGGPVGALVQNAANVLVPLSYLKFSRGAEEEADRLGLQYMWNAGYDPTSMLSFFEKIKAREGKDPGKLAKLFSTHPGTGKRIQNARALLTRFPDRGEYTISTSEFIESKNKLFGLTNQRRIDSGDGGSPTLKRKPGTAGDGSDNGSTKEPPTLKRNPAPAN
jgi:beta-barrel assembly-enhancing protease